jgi:hypothetical protein
MFGINRRLIAAIALPAILFLFTGCDDELERRQKDYCPYQDPEQCDLYRK